MRHLAGPWWVIASAVALASYVIAVASMLMWWTSPPYGSIFRDVLRQVALYAGLAVCLPTILLVILLFVRRFARPAATAAVAWMGVSAFLWMPVEPMLAGWAGVVALLILGVSVAAWWRDRTALT